MSESKSLFKKLTDLFRSGPTIRRKVKAYQNKAPGSPSSLDLFRKAHSDVYNSTISAYGSYDRMARYSDFSEMDSTPEICSALDIYAEETVSPDADGGVLHIYSENRKIKQILDNLFYDVLNVEFNLVMWIRNLCKYGDFFLFNDISPEYGVINVFPIPIAEIEREEGFDPEDPGSVRFRWITQGNRILENWQITHFRLLGNDAFLPYGSSVLEGARRIWRQLILIEDAMLVYRVIRAPERRVFYIDVGNIPPENVGDYLQQAQTALKRNAVVDKTTGKVDLRYNPLSVDEDYFLPVRGGDTGTKIDTLAGGQNTSAIEDVEYIQKKLFSALKVPKAYLGYDEEIGAKATLAQEDIRFSRTIQRIQKTVISELNKIAMIHLYSHGYTGEDLLDFELKLSNPSSIAQQQKLELIRTKFEIAGAVPEGLVDKEWIRKNIMDFDDNEIARIEKGKIRDKIADIKLEAIAVDEQEKGGEGDEGGDMFGGGGGGGGLDLFGGPPGGGGETGGEAGGGEGGGMEDLFAGDMKLGTLLGEDDDNEEDDEDKLLFDESDFIESQKKKSYKIKPKNTPKKKKTYNTYGNDYDFGKSNLLGGERGILGGIKVSAPTAKDVLSQGDSKGYNDYQMNKIFDSMDRSLGINQKQNSRKDLLKEDSEVIIIDNDDEV